MNSIDRFVLGTVQFGLQYGVNNTAGKPSLQQVFSILEKAASSGITTLDTADSYGDACQVIGEFTKATKTAFKVNTKFKIGETTAILDQLNRSLEILNVDSINVYFFHEYSDLEKYPSAKEDLTELKKRKLVNEIGISVYTNSQFQKSIDTKWIDVIQIPFNLLDNNSQRGQLIEEAKRKGKKIQARSVFLQGLFFKDIETYPAKLTVLKPYTRTLQQLFTDIGKDVEEVALSYVSAQQCIDNILIGVDTLEQLKTNLQYFSNTLDKRTIETIDKIAVKETEMLYPYNWT